MIDLTPEAWAVKLAGVGGALVSMRFLQGPWYAKLSMAASGAIFSYFAAPYLSVKLGMPEGLSGFLLGLFGMAVVSRFWQFLEATPIGDLWKAALDWIKPKGTP